jgi:putative ABC transport system ATP-binding protein
MTFNANIPAAGLPTVLRTRDLTKDLPLGSGIVHILKGITLDIYQGERVGIIGPSGSGKSTLLGLMGGLDTPTAGTIEIDSVDITNLSEGRLTEVRNEKIGFVFQFFNLVPTLTALENVALPIEFARKPKFNPRKRAKELLELLGMGDRLNHRPSQLSGGQQQRVAIARALANNPPLILADEPTGNLDTETGKIVLNALEDVQRETGTTVVVVTHDPNIAGHMERVLTLVDGKLVESGEAIQV